MIILSWISESDTGLSGTAIASDIKKKANSFGEPFRTILQSIPSETTFWHNRLSSWPTKPWDSRNGTVTLAGDAAHPMTFRKPCHLIISYLNANITHLILYKTADKA